MLLLMYGVRRPFDLVQHVAQVLEVVVGLLQMVIDDVGFLQQLCDLLAHVFSPAAGDTVSVQGGALLGAGAQWRNSGVLERRGLACNPGR